MALLLLIDTATEYGAAAISANNRIVAVEENNNQKEHATFLHPAINKVLKSSAILLNEIDAVGVTIGPGSYTGLRVGLTAAKGICYATDKPLIAVNTLQAMAFASIENTAHIQFSKQVLHAPMMDARRMEVYTALYTTAGEVYSLPQALIVDRPVFAAESEIFEIVLSGDGSKKLEPNSYKNNFHFIQTLYSINHVSEIANRHFENKLFEDVAYCEPFYLKPFYTTAFVKK